MLANSDIYGALKGPIINPNQKIKIKAVNILGVVLGRSL